MGFQGSNHVVELTGWWEPETTLIWYKWLKQAPSLKMTPATPQQSPTQSISHVFLFRVGLLIGLRWLGRSASQAPSLQHCMTHITVHYCTLHSATCRLVAVLSVYCCIGGRYACQPSSGLTAEGFLLVAICCDHNRDSIWSWLPKQHTAGISSILIPTQQGAGCLCHMSTESCLFRWHSHLGRI